MVRSVGIGRCCHFSGFGNLISDYFDYLHHVDRKETFGSSRMLVNKVFTPKTFLYFGLTLLLAGSLIGLYLLLNTSENLFWIGAIGVLSTYFYYKLKYNALGDILQFLLFTVCLFRSVRIWFLPIRYVGKYF